MTSYSRAIKESSPAFIEEARIFSSFLAPLRGEVVKTIRRHPGSIPGGGGRWGGVFYGNILVPKARRDEHVTWNRPCPVRHSEPKKSLKVSTASRFYERPSRDDVVVDAPIPAGKRALTINPRRTASSFTGKRGSRILMASTAIEAFGQLVFSLALRISFLRSPG